MEKTLLTPKDLADAIGASESSLRRWIDSGDIRISRTAGGHRRIPVNEAVQFVRKIGARVVRPDILGLGSIGPLRTSPDGDLDKNQADELFEALQAGDRALARSLVYSWYLDGTTLPALFDGPIRAAMHRLGSLWTHGERGILTEHRATEICLSVLNELRNLLTEPDASAPLALGGAPAFDPYAVPTTMAALVLQDAGLRAINYGPNTPVELLGVEAVERSARMVWVSISASQDPKTLRTGIRRLAEKLNAHDIEFVVGGVGAANCTDGSAGKIHLVSSMAELAAFGKGLLARPAMPASS